MKSFFFKMNSRNHVRKSLCPTFKPRNDLYSRDKGNQLSELSDASDAEWENLQSKLHQPNINVQDDYTFEDQYDPFDPLNNIENLPVCANMELQIEAKQKEIDRVQQIALDLQDRFVWDLSLAIKKELFRKNMKDHHKREVIANCGISEIVGRNQNDPKSPEEWKEWITSQFPCTERI